MNGVDASDALERALDEIRRLERRVQELEGRLGRLESPAPPANPREFGPALLPADSRRHFRAVDKALSLLGLAPDQPRTPPPPAETREPIPSERPEAARTLAALEKARSFFGRPSPAPRAEPPPPEQPAAAAEPDLVPPPEIVAPEPLAPRPRAEPAPVPIDDAMQLELESRHDVAERLLTAAVFLVALGGAGVALAQWSRFGELLGLAAALLFAAFAAVPHAGSIHVRAIAAGGAAFAGNLLLLSATPALGGLVAPAAFGSALLFAAIAARTLHPLAVLLGFAPSLGLGYLVAAPPAFLLASLLAAGIAALRVRRLQPSILAAAVAAPLLHRAGALESAVAAALLFVQPVASPFLFKKPARSAPVLALLAMALFAWSIHAIGLGSRLDRAVALLLGGAVAALCGAAMPRGEEALRGVLKAGAVLLVLSILPAGFEGRTLAAVALAVSTALGLFALFSEDGTLRAAAAIVLLLALFVLAVEGPTPFLCMGGAGAAGLLFAVRVPGGGATALRPMLGTIAVALALGAFPGLLPDSLLACAWLASSLGLTLLGAWQGGILHAVAAAVWLLLDRPRDPSQFQFLTGAVALAITFALFRVRRDAAVTTPVDAAPAA